MERTETSAKITTILLSEKQVSAKLKKLAGQIKQAYSRSEKVVVIVTLSGAKVFADELFGLINSSKFEINYINASSYKDKLKTSGFVELKGLDKLKLIGEDILIVDDIYDSGLTMGAIVDFINNSKPKSLRTCVLLVKQIQTARYVHIDFHAAKVPDCFVIGYGLDYKGQYRDLPFIARLEITSDNI